MNTIAAIHARQSIGVLKPNPVSRQQIEILLDAAAQAPNHYKVRPWRMVVLTGNARDRLGEVLEQIFRARFPEANEGALAKERGKPLRAPLVIAVGVDKSEDPRVKEIENVCAAAAACQNILLAATDLGLAGHWRTGDAVNEVAVKTFLGLAPDQQLIAFLYLGAPAASVEATTRPSFEDRVLWMD